MAERYWGRGFGLILQSEIAVPGASPFRAQPMADIRIALGSVSSSGGEWLSAGPERSLLLDLAPNARFRCTADTVTVEPLSGADAAMVSALLIASALPACLWLRGDAVLHASTFVPTGASRAVGVCGGSGSGKSTALARMLERGARAVGDDTVRIVASGDAFIASGLPAAYRRRISAHGEDRQLVAIAPAQQCGQAPLQAFFVPRRAQDGEMPWFERLSGVAKIPALLSQRHRPAMPEILGSEPQLLSHFAQIAALDIYLWFRPPGPPNLSDDELEFLEKVAKGEA